MTQSKAERVRREELTKALEGYLRKAQQEPSGEEMYELRANFPAGTTVVNVLTGRKIKV